MSSRRIVIKFGTSTLTGESTSLSSPRLVDLSRQVAALAQEGHQPVIVSSGAIAAGREALGFPHLPDFIPAKQMLAAVGQPRLMAYYEQYFRIYGRTVAQILLTRTDFADRRRYLNARDTLEALLNQGVIPIINENDTIATEEIRVGDNDNLSALVATLVEADLLILLTDQPGLFTSDPRRYPQAKVIAEISTPRIPAEIWQAAGSSTTGLGTGGMVTKLQAADLARRSGTAVLIARGSDPNVILKAANGEAEGTRLTPIVSKMESRKRYLLSGMRSSRILQIDEGAAKALRHGGSLLPVGIQRIEGTFERGDTVRVLDLSGIEVAVGLVNYSSRDLEQLCGHQSGEIESLLGFTFGEEVIHRNHMTLL